MISPTEFVPPFGASIYIPPSWGGKELGLDADVHLHLAGAREDDARDAGPVLLRAHVEQKLHGGHAGLADVGLAIERRPLLIGRVAGEHDVAVLLGATPESDRLSLLTGSREVDADHVHALAEGEVAGYGATDAGEDELLAALQEQVGTLQV